MGTASETCPPDSFVPNIKDGVNYPLGKQRPATGFDVTSGYAGTPRSAPWSTPSPARRWVFRPQGARCRHPAVRALARGTR